MRTILKGSAAWWAGVPAAWGPTWRCVAALLGVQLLAPVPGAARAQGPEPAPGARTWSLGARVIPIVTRAAPGLHGRALTEAYLTQPVVAGHARLADGRVELTGALNFEGVTLRRGELNAGIWGEGYVDRRHPHTFLHEAMAAATLAGGRWGRVAGGFSAGRGFVPFGTDDPMARPLVKFPANHHLAQVLERLVAIAALRVGPAIVEAGVFNGDEPTEPADVGTPGRFGDSWASRLTLLPTDGVEIQGSHARVASPEVRDGTGLDQRKWSASLRAESRAAAGGRRYLLLEWARTTEYDDAIRGFTVQSWLGEASVPWRSVEAAVRLERTTRREEERLADPFRTPRPHYDAHWLGATRWDIATANLTWRARRAARPFVEVARLRAVEARPPSLFVPAELYGSERMWSLSAGVRLEAGSGHGRMGRYGVALPRDPRDPRGPPGAHAHP